MAELKGEFPTKGTLQAVLAVNLAAKNIPPAEEKVKFLAAAREFLRATG